jgi:hypothetical protein
MGGFSSGSYSFAKISAQADEFLESNLRPCLEGNHTKPSFIRGGANIVVLK